MADLEYFKPKIISIKNHPVLTERWVQDTIADDPSILGLGDLALKDKERIQPKAGRLDLLLQDLDNNTRYEVEIQLGKTDESHIIRTIEYWDLERKRYPQYDHIAVIVAEDVTSRFLNVMGLFNGVIPLIGIQMNAIAVDDKLGLLFIKVLDETTLGLVDEDEEHYEAVDRAYWEARATSDTLSMVDDLLKIMHEWDSRPQIKLNRGYIGLAIDGRPNNFVLFKPKKGWLGLNARVGRSEEVDSMLDEASLESQYNSRTGRYVIRVSKGDIAKHRDVLADVMRRAQVEYGN